MLVGSLVPWIKYNRFDKRRANAPNGSCGPGGITAGTFVNPFAANAFKIGLGADQDGFIIFSTTWRTPSGVVQPSLPIPTGKVKILLSSNKASLPQEEFVSYQKSSDIHEEISRLKHFIDEQKALLKSAVPAGKQIDFIAQEMQRETNTIGSKLQDKIVSNAVIALKSKIEKIREQAQNIE